MKRHLDFLAATVLICIPVCIIIGILHTRSQIQQIKITPDSVYQHRADSMVDAIREKSDIKQ